MIYKHKTEGRCPKDFRNYQNLIELLKNLRDGNANKTEILKNHILFKSDLGERRKRNPDFKSEEQVTVIQNVDKFFDLKEKLFDFCRDFFFFFAI